MTKASVEIPGIRGLVDGEPTSVDIDRLELESSRRALKLLRERIPQEQMEELLADDLQATDKLWREWAAASDGSWKPSVAEFEVAGLSKDQFTEWWSTALDDLYGVIFPGFPEHYRFGWVQDPRGGDEKCYRVVEELGHVPFRMYCSFGSEWAPVETTPGYEQMMVGVGRLQDGTEVVRFFNQIKETSEGFALKAGVYVVSAAPDIVVESHIDQLFVEWTRWIEIAFKKYGVVS
jgi:hypothetical protein